MKKSFICCFLLMIGCQSIAQLVNLSISTNEVRFDNPIDSVISVVLIKGTSSADIVSVLKSDEGVIINNLCSGCVYKMNYAIGKETFEKVFATQSSSSGNIEHYFNYELPNWPNSNLLPNGESYDEVILAIRQLIRNAKSTIDYCAYNTNVTSIVNELIDAKARGVRVRVIVERDNNNNGFNGSMPFPILQDRNPDLMHNKFIIIDANEVDNSYVVNGSMNFTSGQMSFDPNHLMIIQDQSLARAYEIEFEEMWGSANENFDVVKSRFGNEKTDNTPHEFLIGDVRAELYFSPSDNTSRQIAAALNTGEHHIDLGLLIFTYWDLRDVLIEKIRQGVRVRGIVEDDENSEAVISRLRSEGADIKYHYANGIYHHKMAVIDGEFPDSNPLLVSGSHNWTYTAETGNDENSMIFYDSDIAEMYKRAFSAKWNEFATDIHDDTTDSDGLISPNPTNGPIHFSGFLENVLILDLNGNILVTNDGEMPINKLDISRLAPGTYLLKATQNKAVINHKIIKI